ncbi:MAG TPA: anti-sigma factor [Steroidobacteraceae bacterium]|nr:anti-sigma factor [Steroidobacteraceae bacterium]
MNELTDKPGEDSGGDPPSDDVLAGEYVLGVLDAEQRLAVETRIKAEPIFAQRVAEWEQRLGPMAASIEPIDVPDHVWARICERLGWPAASRVRTQPWHSIGFWRTVAAAAAVIAIGAIIVGVSPMLAPRSNQAALPAAEPVTTLAHDDGTPGWLASVDARRAALLVVPVPMAPDSRGRVPELWLIAPGKAPRPLGLLSNARTDALVVPADLRAALTTSGTVLAVSLEPPGGAPNGAPTGPIIAKGTIQL